MPQITPLLHKESPPEGWEFDSRTVQVQHRSELLRKQALLVLQGVRVNVQNRRKRKKLKTFSTSSCKLD